MEGALASRQPPDEQSAFVVHGDEVESPPQRGSAGTGVPRRSTRFSKHGRLAGTQTPSPCPQSLLLLQGTSDADEQFPDDGVSIPLRHKSISAGLQQRSLVAAPQIKPEQGLGAPWRFTTIPSPASQ